MLLEFKTKNYKSFIDEAIFSLKAAPKQTGLDYSILNEKIRNKTFKGLCSSVIYGPNAAGKTNLIGAMEVFRSIVLKGNIKNSDNIDSPNSAISNLELIPNNKFTKPKPTEFSVEFIENGMRIKYSISIDLGYFLKLDYERKIVFEELTIDDKMIFRRMRHNKIEIGDIKSIDKYLTVFAKENIDMWIKVALSSSSSSNKEELFLTNEFKFLISQSITNVIIKWFTHKFILIYHADLLRLTTKLNKKEDAILTDRSTNKAAEIFGINSNGIGYIKKDDDPECKLCSVISTKNDEEIIAVPSELYESYGTIRFVNLFPIICNTIINGATLVIDEFDASIHPMALMSIINIFHNDNINIHHAQLIFNTHNPIFLNSNLFRRDEIKFVERDEETDSSNIYSMADFGTSGKNGIRKNEDYMSNYFISKYGAIKDIDFTPVFEELILESEKVKLVWDENL